MKFRVPPITQANSWNDSRLEDQGWGEPHCTWSTLVAIEEGLLTVAGFLGAHLPVLRVEVLSPGYRSLFQLPLPHQAWPLEKPIQEPRELWKKLVKGACACIWAWIVHYITLLLTFFLMKWHVLLSKCISSITFKIKFSLIANLASVRCILLLLPLMFQPPWTASPKHVPKP